MAKELTQESFELTNRFNEYPYLLHCDDVEGLIRMSFNKKSNTIRITRRCIPITDGEHYGFSNQKSGFYNKGEGPFYGSYIRRNESPEIYAKWLEFMTERYKKLKREYKRQVPGQLSIFDMEV